MSIAGRSERPGENVFVCLEKEAKIKFKLSKLQVTTKQRASNTSQMCVYSKSKC